MIVGQIGSGHTLDELLAGYPYLEREDIPEGIAICGLARRGTRGRAVQELMTFLVNMSLSPGLGEFFFLTAVSRQFIGPRSDPATP
jgi:hypothetical protein